MAGKGQPDRGHPLSAQEIDRRIGEQLSARRVRYTRGRRTVAASLGDASGPLSVSDLHDRLDGSLPLSSLYRTLTVLEAAGVLLRSHDAEGVARYELAEWLSGHHHHLVCVECGVTVDFDADDQVERELRALAEAAGASAGFEVSGHRLDLEGRCHSCQTR